MGFQHTHTNLPCFLSLPPAGKEAQLGGIGFHALYPTLG